MRLTAKGERWLIAVYQTALIALAMAAFVVVMGFVGWIETLGS